MKIKDIEIKACIFDLDGTILDSCSIWAEVDIEFFRKRNLTIPKDYAQAIMPLGLEESAIYTKEVCGLDESIEDIMNEWLSGVKNKYHHEVQLKKHAEKLLKTLDEAKVPMVIATANTPDCFEPCLDRLGVSKYFIKAYDVTGLPGGKNSPALFNKCAKELGLKPEEIMVFEDSYIAIKTAKKAGFKTCAIYEKVSWDEEAKKEISDIYIEDFEELL